MPARFATRPARQDGPSPFSSEWFRSPTPAAPPRRVLALPPWVPGPRALSSVLVLLVVATAAIAATGPEVPSGAATAGQEGENEARLLAAAATETPAATETSTAAPPTATSTTDAAAGVGSSAAVPTPTPTFVAMPAFASPPAIRPAAAEADGLLPANRILTYYGHPHDANMGILGEYDLPELRDRLLVEAANYEAADPSRPVIPAFEVIATVAQRDPGDDGTFILDTDEETIAEYVEFAEANDMLVFLDLQIGRGTVAAEIEKVRPFLEEPHVHLALDPEFAIAEGEVPGVYIGELSAESIAYAQETLAAISEEQGIPPKVLIVHQFREDMIIGKDQIRPVPGVQFVLDADGYGAPELKTDVYNILVRDEPIEFNGIKHFYKQDKPVMTAAETLALNPSPDLIIYQ